MRHTSNVLLNLGSFLGRILLITTALVFSATTALANGLSEWMDAQKKESIERLMLNVSPKDARPGAVIASPSKTDPDYYSHWIRDAALVMGVVQQLAETSATLADYNRYRRELDNFVAFTTFNQNTYAITGLGEPKFNVDGTSFTLPWGRPQNDGPALRTLTLIRFAKHLLSRGENNYVQNKLYRPELPARTVIKQDLEYVAHHWQDKNFDLWEEVKGDHFYTRLIQAHALLDGADLADLLNDKGAADFYRLQSNKIYLSLFSHYDNHRGTVIENINRVDGLDYKYTGFDTATILSLNQMVHLSNHRLVSPDQANILGSFAGIDEHFQKIYPINSKNAELGTAIGRYPEDRYFGGNPWFLTTTAMAEFLYRYYIETKKPNHVININASSLKFWNLITGEFKKGITLTLGEKIASGSDKFQILQSALLFRADNYIERVRMHIGAGGQMDEQMDRNNGFMRSARDLTWSYAAFITAIQVRKMAVEN